MENNLESLPLPRRLEELFQEIVSSLGQEDRAAWEDHKKSAQLKVCARYTSKLLRQGEDPLRLIPETVSKRCLIPLLKKCAAMGAADLDMSCGWETTQSPVPLDIETEQAVATLRGQAVTVTDAEFDATSIVIETRGALQQSQFIETVSRTSMLARLAHVKESKSYRGARVRDAGGTIVTIKTWDDYCKALGMSRAKIDEDLANLAAFGDNLLKMQDSLGIGYRELRKMRANMAGLPEADQQQLRAEIEKAEDKDELLATLDEMGARNARLNAEKKELEKQLATNDRLLKEAREKEYATRQKMEKAFNPACQTEEEKAIERQMGCLRAMISGKCVEFENAGSSMAAAFRRMISDEGRGRLTDQQLDDLVNWANDRLSLACAKVADYLLTAGADVDMATAMQAIDLPREEPED